MPKIGLIFFFLGSFCVAQDRDLRSWNAIALSYKPKGKWDFNVEGQFRFKDNFTAWDEYFGQFQVNRRLVKGLKLGGAARYIFENDDQGQVQGTEKHLRFHVDLRYRKKINRYTLRSRVRYQHKDELGVSKKARQFFRIKLGAEYNIRRWKLDPIMDFELFHKLGPGEVGWDRYRITLRTGYKMKALGKIGTFYRLQGDIKQENREILHIIGLKYSYTIR